MALADFYGLHSSYNLAEELQMSKLEKELCRCFTGLEVVGRRGWLVPILLTAVMKDAVSLLVKCRDSVEVNPANEYVFACMN